MIKIDHKLSILGAMIPVLLSNGAYAYTINNNDSLKEIEQYKLSQLDTRLTSNNVINDPFDSFLTKNTTELSKGIRPSENIKNDKKNTIDFLRKNGLITQNKQRISQVSGDINQVNSDELVRKHYAFSGSCTSFPSIYTTETTCTANGHTWNGGGGDVTAPTFDAAGSTPLDNATNVSVSNNIVIGFSENIVAGTGNITLRDVTGGSNTQVFDITGATATTAPVAGAIGIVGDKV